MLEFTENNRATTSVDFGEAHVGSEVTRAISVAGDAVLKGPASGPFSITSGSVRGGQRTFRVKYRPITAGSDSANVTATRGKETAELALSGTAFEGSIEVVDMTGLLDLGTAHVGETRTIDVEMKNLCTVDVTLSATLESPTLDSADVVDITPDELPAGGPNAAALPVRVTFSPSASQPGARDDYRGTLHATVAGASETVPIDINVSELRGVGINAEKADDTAALLATQMPGLGRVSSDGNNYYRVSVPTEKTKLYLGKNAVDSSNDGFGLSTEGGGAVTANDGVIIAAGYDATSGNVGGIASAFAVLDGTLALGFGARGAFDAFRGGKWKSAAKWAGLTGGFLGVIGGVASMTAAGGGYPLGGVTLYGLGGVLIGSPTFSAFHSVSGLVLHSLFPLMVADIDAEIFAMNSASLTGFRHANVQSHKETLVASDGDVTIQAKGGGWTKTVLGKAIGTGKKQKGVVDVFVGDREGKSVAEGGATYRAQLRHDSGIALGYCRPGTNAALYSNGTLEFDPTHPMFELRIRSVFLSAENAEVEVSKDLVRLGAHELAANKSPVMASVKDPDIRLVTAQDRRSIALNCGDSRIAIDEDGIVLCSGNFAVSISRDGGIQLGTTDGAAFKDDKPLIAFKDQALLVASPSAVELVAGRKKATWTPANLQLDGFMKFERGSITGSPTVTLQGRAVPLPSTSPINLAVIMQERRRLLQGNEDDDEAEPDDDDWLS